MSMLKKSALIACLCAAPLIGAVARDGITVFQKGKSFSEKAITLKIGQELLFINDDKVAHNVYSMVNGAKVDLGLQRPNQEGIMSFDTAGRYRVRCAIHPRMKMMVTVE
ncbi:MAG: hypothetical protein JKY60_07330 [Kordiimonadaceae bacterium]|nr:hypothetical protein [Kordiimonadaceae bacterium]